MLDLNKLFADRLSNGACQTVAMTRYHALREKSYAENFEWFARPKQHTNRKPRSGVAMCGSENDQQNDLNTNVLKKWAEAVSNILKKFHRLRTILKDLEAF